MSRFVLVIGVGLLAANAAYADCPIVNNQRDITSLVCSLNSGYDPTPNPRTGPKYTPPSCSGSAAQASDIQGAFELTNGVPGLQRDLCNLTNIFVIPDQGEHSWGKWEDPTFPVDPNNPNVPGSGKEYIALQSLDSSGKSTFGNTLPQTQDAHLNALEIPTGCGARRGYSGRRGRSGPSGLACHSDNAEKLPSPFTSVKLSVLYLLAHEMGHIKWREAIRRDAGSLKPPNALGNCTVDDFMNGSWQADSGRTIAKTQRWVGITPNDEFGSRAHSIGPPWGIAKAQNLSSIYLFGMPTALGDHNPVEDFAETYAIQAIIMATSNVSPQYQLLMTINSRPIIVINVLDIKRQNKDLSAKVQCVQPLLQ